MRCLIQRVRQAQVDIDGKCVGKIGAGFMILFGAAPDDDRDTADFIAKKVAALRVFSDENGKMNLSLTDVGGEALIVSQFTLYADCRKGNRPSYTGACEPKRASELYDRFCEAVAAYGIKVENGVFGEDMQVSLINDGPVTVMLDSDVIYRGAQCSK